MAVKTLAELKEYFNTGDTPTESNYSDLIDTLFSMSGGGGGRVYTTTPALDGGSFDGKPTYSFIYEFGDLSNSSSATIDLQTVHNMSIEKLVDARVFEDDLALKSALTCGKFANCGVTSAGSDITVNAEDVILGGYAILTFTIV